MRQKNPDNMKKFFDWIKKFKELVAIVLAAIASIFYFFLKNKAYTPPDNSEENSEIDKSSGKVEILSEDLTSLKKEESSIREGINKIIKEEDQKDDEDDLDDFFDSRGF